MGKIRPWTVTDYPYVPYYYHCGDTLRDPGKPWHGVFACHKDDLPTLIGITFRIFLPTLPQAMRAARLFTAMPLFARDICPFCWDYDLWYYYTASLPRINIHRGQNHMLVPPTFLWDWENVDPPPGFTWAGT